MSKEVRTRLTGDLEKRFNKFKGERNMSLSEATQSLITRGLDAQERDDTHELISSQFSINVQTLMAVQRLLSAVSEDELEAARKDASTYLKKKGVIK